jgi:tRNA-splicing ligase RtcB
MMGGRNDRVSQRVEATGDATGVIATGDDRVSPVAVIGTRPIRESFDASDILTNCRSYPRDEAPQAYKDFNEVLRSVEMAGLAERVARLRATFVIKGADKSTRGAA